MRAEDGGCQTRWPLDCAATLFLLGGAKRRRFNNRLCATPREKIDREALEKTAHKYLLFFARFGLGRSRMYSEPVATFPEIGPMRRGEVLLLPEAHAWNARASGWR